MVMDEVDRVLSMRISPRARNPQDNEGLRTLLVHRLAGGLKVVWRRSLQRETQSSMFCETCNQWVRTGDHVPVIWKCPRCRREYRIEFAVYEELEPRSATSPAPDGTV